MIGNRNPISTQQRSVPVRKSVWGPCLWKFFHSVGYALGNISNKNERCEKTNEIWKHTKSLINTIPCPSCRKHAMNEYTTTRYTNPDDSHCDWYQQWAFQFHNKVNKRLHKPIMSWEDSVKIASSLNTSEQFNGYIKSINGWRYNRLSHMITSIENILKTI
jgi:hypothetical protein